MQLAMSERQAHDLCAKEKVAISALESLPGGGVRLVCSRQAALRSSGKKPNRRSCRSRRREKSIAPPHRSGELIGGSLSAANLAMSAKLPRLRCGAGVSGSRLSPGILLFFSER